jgi:hypothetical protein
MEDEAYKRIKKLGGIYGYDYGKIKLANRILKRHLQHN